MSNLKLLIAEIRYRKLNFLLSLLGITAAVAMFTCGTLLIDGYHRDQRQRLEAKEARTAAELSKIDRDVADLQTRTEEELARMEDATRKLMLTMGFNLMIVHRDTDMTDFWSSDFSTVDMPQEYVDRLAAGDELTLVTHLVATLQQKIEWNGRKVLLVGYLPETPKAHERKKKPMGYAIEPGTVYVGHELAGDASPGDTIEVLGRPFRIARVLPEKGSKEDITLAVHLKDAQEVLDKAGRVNQILAIGCRCAGERLPQIRQQLETVLPDTRITEFRSIALARDEQRRLVAAERAARIDDLVSYREKRQVQTTKMIDDAAAQLGQWQGQVERFAGIVSPLVVLGCGTWVGLLTLSNVRERRTEIGLMRALGRAGWHIGALFMAKAIVLGCVGGAIGLAVGIGLARLLLSGPLTVAAPHTTPPADMVLWALAGAPTLCAMASYLPIVAAVIEDPAEVLRDH